MSNENLTELELKILLDSKSIEKIELADKYEKSVDDINIILNAIEDKLSSAYYRGVLKEDLLLPRPIAFRIEKAIGETQIGTMKVGSKILEMLSKGIYTASWNSLKELISNSFDADATKVDITYYPLEKKMIIRDNGDGMDYKDFDEHFTFIVKSEKREKGLYTSKYKRPIIGKIGIGFIAVTELCDNLKITSSKENSDIYFIAEIDFSKIMDEKSKDKEFYEVSQFTLTNYKKENPKEHYTEIELLNLKESFIEIMNNKSIEGIKYSSFYPNNFKEVLDKIQDTKNIRTDLGPYWEFLIHFANTIPIEYIDIGPVNLKKLNVKNSIYVDDISLNNYKTAKKIINNLKRKLKKYNFKVTFNDLELRKPILLPHQEEAKEYGKDMLLIPISNDPESNSIVKYTGYFYYQRTRILPEELRGMLIRIKNVAIGSPKVDYLEHPYPGDTTYFPQTYGELYISSGLEDAMNIDRSTFKTTHHEFFEFKDIINKFLRSNVFQKAKNMYSIRRKEKTNSIIQEREVSRNNTIKNIYGDNFNIQEIKTFSDLLVEINKKEEVITLNIIADQFYGFKKDDRLLLQDIALALEMAYDVAKTKEELSNLFWIYLRDISDYRR